MCSTYDFISVILLHIQIFPPKETLCLRALKLHTPIKRTFGLSTSISMWMSHFVQQHVLCTINIPSKISLSQHADRHAHSATHIFYRCCHLEALLSERSKWLIHYIASSFRETSLWTFGRALSVTAVLMPGDPIIEHTLIAQGDFQAH